MFLFQKLGELSKLKILLLNSGGLDSLVVANYLNGTGNELYSLYVDLGQMNSERAKISAKRIADKYCTLGHEIITVSSDLRDTFSTSNGLIKNSYKRNVPTNPVVIIGLGVILAYNLDIKYISTGHKADTGRNVNDFRESVYNLIQNNFREPRILMNPIGHFTTFEETLKKAFDEGLTLEEINLTVSCPEIEPCGKCVKCKGRNSHGLAYN